MIKNILAKRLCIYIFIICIPFIYSPSHAQKSFLIKGSIIDTHNKQSLPNASIVLFDQLTKKIIKAELSDLDGKFEISTQPAIYHLQIQYVGYQEYKIDSLIINESVHLPTIHLLPIEQSLSEVNVTAIKPVIEQNANGITVNVAESSLFTGSSVHEVLQKIPGVSAKDNGLSIRGKKLSVLLDGRLINLPSEEIDNLLKSLPASSIDKIDLITNPTGKYDGQAQAVLSIKTIKAKSDLWGSTISLGAGMGRKMRSNNSVNLYYKKNKLSFSGGWNYLNNSVLRLINRTYSIRSSSPLQLEEQRKENINQYTHTLKLDMDYAIHPNHSVGFSIRPSFNPQKIIHSNTTIFKKETTNQIDSIYQFTNLTNAEYIALAGNVYYKINFDTAKNKEFLINADYYNYQKSWIGNYNTQILQPDFSEKREPILQTNEAPLDILIRSATADYTHIAKYGKWQTGIKTVWATMQNNFIWKTYENENWVTNVSFSDYFRYTENINAGYLGFSNQSNETTIDLSLRIEHTYTKTHSANLKNEYLRNYINLFPVINIQYHPSENHEWTFSYKKNIARPSYQDINPFLRLKTPNSYIQGNAFLRPEIINTCELVYGYKQKLFFITSFIQTNYFIGDVFHQIDSLQAIKSGKQNFNNSYTAYIGITFNQAITSWWNINAYGDIFINRPQISETPLGRVTPAASFNLSSTASLPKDWSLELAGWLVTPFMDGSFTYSLKSSISLGIKKSFLEKKIIVNLLVNARIPIWYRENILYMNYTGNVNEDQRYFILSISYRIGKNKNEIKNRNNNLDIDKRIKE